MARRRFSASSSASRVSRPAFSPVSDSTRAPRPATRASDALPALSASANCRAIRSASCSRLAMRSSRLRLSFSSVSSLTSRPCRSVRSSPISPRRASRSDSSVLSWPRRASRSDSSASSRSRRPVKSFSSPAFSPTSRSRSPIAARRSAVRSTIVFSASAARPSAFSILDLPPSSSSERLAICVISRSMVRSRPTSSSPRKNWAVIKIIDTITKTINRPDKASTKPGQISKRRCGRLRPAI